MKPHAGAVTDTDLVAVGHPPPSTIFNQPPTTLASVSPVPHRPPIPKPSAVEARGGEPVMLFCTT